MNATNIFVSSVCESTSIKIQGLSALSEAVVRGDEDVVKMLISSGCPVDVGVPKSRDDECFLLLTEYSGWTPLTWSVL